MSPVGRTNRLLDGAPGIPPLIFVMDGDIEGPGAVPIDGPPGIVVPLGIVAAVCGAPMLGAAGAVGAATEGAAPGVAGSGVIPSVKLADIPGC